MYKVIFHKRAKSFYDRLPKRQKKRLNKAIDKLEDNPLYGKDIKKLKGDLQGKYRLKVGPFRIVYLVNKERNLVVVESIGPRGNIY